MSTAILVLQLHGENFFQVEKFEISHFQAVHCVIKNAISRKVFNRFSKTFLLLRDMENRYLCRKFHCAAILVLQLQGENFFQVEKFEISHFQAVHRVSKNAISPKVFKRFPKTFLLLKDVENRYLRRKDHERSYFSFATEKTLYHQRYSNDFQEHPFC